MALHSPRFGWAWEDNERESRKKSLRDIQREMAKLSEQVSRIKTSLPAFAEIAEQTFKAIQAALGKLERLDISNKGTKYKSLSPEEFDKLLEKAPEVLRLWNVLSSSPVYIAAVKDINKTIKLKNAVTRQNEAQQKAAMEMLANQLQPVYDLLARGELNDALHHPITLIALQSKSPE